MTWDRMIEPQPPVVGRVRDVFAWHLWFFVLFGSTLVSFTTASDGSFPMLYMSWVGFFGLLGTTLIAGYEVVHLEWHKWMKDRELALRESAMFPPAVKSKVPFPPVRFVTYLWDRREETGKFPTIDECEAQGFHRQLSQEWYAQMVAAGAIVNRRPKQTAGDPAPEWDYARFVQAAHDSS